MTIKDWPEGERPRERLIARGAQALSDAELLAIFLRTGVTGRSALDLARIALERAGGLNALLTSTCQDFSQTPGLGPAKWTQLQAVMELARRVLREELASGEVLNSPQRLRDFLALRLGGLAHEVFVAIYLDAQNRLLADEILFTGTLTQTSVYPREVVKAALKHNAAALILAHNHPSGLAEPSRADELLTASLRSALAMVDVRVLDHFIVAGNRSLSFAERGLL
ncbi:MAG: DNA repair protein RadC [Burkholderiaceae bacterium]